METQKKSQPMKYVKPVLKTRQIQLGVFGEYGEGSGGEVSPQPIKLDDPLNYTIE